MSPLSRSWPPSASLRTIGSNGHRFSPQGGETPAAVGSSPAAAILPHGASKVLVLADLGMLGASEDPPADRRFWTSLARNAR